MYVCMYVCMYVYIYQCIVHTTPHIIHTCTFHTYHTFHTYYNMMPTILTTIARKRIVTSTGAKKSETRRKGNITTDMEKTTKKPRLASLL